MEYKIISRREEPVLVYSGEDDETVMATHTLVFTLVEYNFAGTIVTVEIPHYNPVNEEYIILGIENRGITEMKKLGMLN
jgi:hypothetical protein